MDHLGEQYLELRSWLLAHPEAILAMVFAMAMLEAVAIVGAIVPGVALLFVLSVLAAHADIGFWPLLVAGVSGAMAGDGVSYAIGRHFQHRIEGVWPFRTHPQWLAGSEAFVERHGGKSIILGRFIGPLRAFVPMAAGIFRMPPLYFLWMNFLSALAWAPFHLVPGYTFGSAVADDWLPEREQLLFVAALLIAVAVLSWLLPALERWQARRPARPNTGADYDADGHPAGQRVARWLAAAGLSGFLLCAVLLPWLAPLDQALAAPLFTLRHPALDHLFVALATLGDRNSLLLFGAVILGWLAWRREWPTFRLLLATAVAGVALPELLKLAFAVPRPALVAAPPPSFAFPSGHAFGSLLVWGFLLVFLARQVPSLWMDYLRPVLLGLMVFTLASRPYLGVHWVSDVVAGGCLGLAVVAALRWRWHRLPRPALPAAECVAVALAAIVLVALAQAWPLHAAALRAHAPL